MSRDVSKFESSKSNDVPIIKKKTYKYIHTHILLNIVNA